MGNNPMDKGRNFLLAIFWLPWLFITAIRMFFRYGAAGAKSRAMIAEKRVAEMEKRKEVISMQAIEDFLLGRRED